MIPEPCEALSSPDEFVCTLPKAHDVDHEAHGIDDAVIHHTWPQAT